MSSNNNNSAASTGIAIVFGLFAAIAMFAFAFFAFVAFVLTILAICAWNKPLHIGGKLSIQPEEARSFVWRGLMGMWMLPAFVLFVNVFLGVHINWGYLPHLMVFGYVAGSLGLEMMMADDGSDHSHAEPRQHHEVLPPQPSQRNLPAAPRESFSYASWDDEEENRR